MNGTRENLDCSQPKQSISSKSPLSLSCGLGCFTITFFSAEKLSKSFRLSIYTRSCQHICSHFFSPCAKVRRKNISWKFFFLGIPTVVKTNILIRSMGPVSELDMVFL